MPRPSRAPKLRRPEGLTEDRLEFLIHGDNIIAPEHPPFRDEDDARSCWHEYREEILGGCCDSEPGRHHFLPGCRPWAYWRFDCGIQPPKRQAAALGELGEGERAVVIDLAVAQLEKTTGTRLDLDIRHAGIERDLLRVWPCHLRLFDYDPATGKSTTAAWVKLRQQRELTGEEWDGAALDPVTAYAHAVVAAGQNPK